VTYESTYAKPEDLKALRELREEFDMMRLSTSNDDMVRITYPQDHAFMVDGLVHPLFLILVNRGERFDQLWRDCAVWSGSRDEYLANRFGLTLMAVRLIIDAYAESVSEAERKDFAAKMTGLKAVIRDLDHEIDILERMGT
jgi:hypothetical protein